MWTVGMMFLAMLGASASSAQTTLGEQLFHSIETGDVASVSRILASDPSVANATNARGRSAVLVALLRNERGFIPPRRNAVLQAILQAKPKLSFLEACGVGDSALVRAMLEEQPALAKAWHPLGWSALHLAAFSGDAETVRLLVAGGADVNARAKTKFLNTPLQAALLAGQRETAEVLIEHGADVLIRQNSGFTPMHEAALLGRRDLIDLLLTHGAEINSRADDGRTPLTEALRGNHAELAAYLRSKGARGGEITADLTKSPE